MNKKNEEARQLCSARARTSPHPVNVLISDSHLCLRKKYGSRVHESDHVAVHGTLQHTRLLSKPNTSVNVFKWN